MGKWDNLNKELDDALDSMTSEDWNKIKMRNYMKKVYKEYLVHTIDGVKNGFDRIKGYLDGCLVEFDGENEHISNPSFQYGYRPHTKEEFINKCKTDNEFSEKWGLKIEERELSLEERYNLIEKDKHIQFVNWQSLGTGRVKEGLDENNIPAKLITLTYNNETIESYE